MTQQQPVEPVTGLTLLSQVLTLLNEDQSRDVSLALTYNQRTGKWVVLHLARMQKTGDPQASDLWSVVPFSTGAKVEDALKDAISLRFHRIIGGY